MRRNQKPECMRGPFLTERSRDVAWLRLYAVIFTDSALALLGRCCPFGGLGALHFTQTGSLALQSTQVEQLGAAHLVGAHYFHFINDFGVQGEDAFHALAKADLAHGEAALRAVTAGNHGAFKRLDAFLVAFFDPDLNADGVSRLQVGDVIALQLGGKPCQNWML